MARPHFGHQSQVQVVTCASRPGVELTPGRSQKVKALIDSTKEVFIPVGAETECPWQCPKMMAASGSKKRNTVGGGGGV